MVNCDLNAGVRWATRISLDKQAELCQKTLGEDGCQKCTIDELCDGFGYGRIEIQRKLECQCSCHDIIDQLRGLTN